jgi:PAS domain S-box-containing protein
MKGLLNFKKFRASLGPVEQAQIVTSTAVIVTLLTIVVVRMTSGHTIGWLLFGNVLTVGIFGFIIVFFTLKYGRLLEEQKQELLALNTFAESVNRAIDIQFLLQSALYEMRRLLNVEYGWIYRVEGDLLILKAAHGAEDLNVSIIDPVHEIHQDRINWINSPRIVKRPGRHSSDKKGLLTWEYGVIESWASVPILMKGQMFGLIVLASTNREVFTAKHIDLIMAFANQIGTAMENATLFERVRKSEERYIDLFEHSPDMSHIVNSDGIIISCNQTEATTLGYSKNEIIGQSILKFYPPEYHDEAKQILHEIFQNNHEIKDLEERMITKKGSVINVSVNASVIRDETGQPLVRAVARNITEKKNLEARVFHAQRIDSIGNLAGGVAHDFNNILTSILGSTSIMKRKMKREDQWYRFTDIIETAARRGAALTRQLLTFARKSNVQFRPIIVNDIIEETLRLFERSIDKTIIIKKDLADEVCIINGDDGQLQQSLLNLLINSRDAMPNGGTITVQSKKIRIHKSTSLTQEVREGDYAIISISDTGIGIKKDIQQNIFDPFFTTKDPGKGTGLGLSVVYGVVNSHNGFITFESESEKGTHFMMHFPVIQVGEHMRQQIRSSKLKHGKEKILVVDDEKDVANVISGMLENLGYIVTTVDSGRKAIELYKRKKRFDIVVLDLNMPKMSGKVTFSRLRKIDPDIRVVISTGYSDRDMDISQWQGAVSAFLQKPYQIQELSETIRYVLKIN